MNLDENKKSVLKVISFILGVFLLSLTYNLFFLPNNLVIGGTTGLSILFKNKMDPTLFIYVATFLLLVISYIFLGKKATRKTLVGSILYPIFVSLTKPLATFLFSYFVFEEFIITVVLAALFYGASNGVIFRTGYTTGGFDVIAKIITKYLKIPEGQALFYANFIVITFGGLAFGFTKVIYALTILYVGSSITNKLVIGISESKVFFIYTREIDKVKDLIIKDLKTGYTVLPTVGGYSHSKGEMIMCVVPTKDYYLFKEMVIIADPTAFFVINDCYDVNGGVKNANLPFI